MLLGGLPRLVAVRVYRLTAVVCALSCVDISWAQSPRALVPLAVKPVIIRVIAHDPTAFTQGLIYTDTILYESAGIIGQSTLRRVSASSGRVITKISVPDVFAEGITVLNGELVQLTWKDGFALRYEFPSLKPKTTVYGYIGEGWGLTNDGTSFIMSNGSDTLYFRDGKFKVTRKLPVTYGNSSLSRLNELEYARGNVYANVWYENYIAEISVANGKVSRVIDCSELVALEKSPKDNVLNGIAYDSKKEEWYLTGKNWTSMFVVKIP